MHFHFLLAILLILTWCGSNCEPQKRSLKSKFQHNTFNSVGCGTRLSNRRVRRIVGGQKSKDHQWPWMVAVHKRKGPNKLFCGGALINKLWVVTAAHCLPNNKSGEKSYRLTLGTNDRSKPFSKTAQLRKIAQSFTHPKFTDARYPPSNFDIALIRMNRSVPLNQYINTVCLANTRAKEPKAGEQCMLAGWGSEAMFGKPRRPPHLWEVAQTVIGTDECDWKYDVPINNKLICTYNWLEGHCDGDSGSSLVYNKYNRWYSVGLSAWTGYCGREPSVFTRVSKMIPWIEETLKSN